MDFAEAVCDSGDGANSMDDELDNEGEACAVDTG